MLQNIGRPALAPKKYSFLPYIFLIHDVRVMSGLLQTTLIIYTCTLKWAV